MITSARIRPSVSLTRFAGGISVSLVLGGLAFYHREAIAFNVRLLHAKMVADRFYARYRGIIKDIPYGYLPAQKLDIYRPYSDGPHPVVIWVHGGGWSTGSKELYASVAQRLVRKNIVVVIPGYTLYPDAHAFDQAHEIARAFQWTRENIARYGGDPDRVILGGQSAGAHLTGLVALDATYLNELNRSPAEICGWYGIAGPYSIPVQVEYERTVKRRNIRLLLDFFNGQINFERGSPRSFVRGDTMPILLIHGSADKTVPPAVSQDLHSALYALGAPSTLRVYKGAGHAGLLFDALAQTEPQLVSDLVKFTKSCPPVINREPHRANL